MPERTSKRGMLRVDWQWKPVGRVRVSWGYTRRERDEFVSCLDLLRKNARVTELRAIKDGRLHPAQVIEAKNLGRLLQLDLLLDVKQRLPLWQTFRDLIDQRGGESTRYTYHRSLRKLERVSGLPASATVEDLLTLQKHTLRRQYVSPVSWNHARVVLLTCCSALFGVDHAFRKDLKKMLGPREKEPKRPLSVTPARFWLLVDKLPEHCKAPIITLAVCGLRFEEYMQLSATSLREYAVFVSGRVKTVESEGLVHVSPELWPWVEQAIPAPLGRKQLRKQFQRASIAVGLGHREPRLKMGIERLTYTGLRIHDLRHLTAIFALDGGATVNQVQTLMRHTKAEQTMDYARLTDGKRAADAIGRALEREVTPNATQQADA